VVVVKVVGGQVAEVASQIDLSRPRLIPENTEEQRETYPGALLAFANFRDASMLVPVNY
jgi:hypothetical protein